jgi:DNA-binding transcriptional LysR family regulator
MGNVDMDMQQVKYFLALCEELNFTRAAIRCGISQPSLTNAIKRLEEELGGQLFHRRPSTRLSTLGRAVRPHLRKIVKSVDMACQAALVHKTRGQWGAPRRIAQQFRNDRSSPRRRTQV